MISLKRLSLSFIWLHIHLFLSSASYITSQFTLCFLDIISIFSTAHKEYKSFSSHNRYTVLNSCLTCFKQGFIAQSVEHCTGITGLHRIGASEFWGGFICNCLSYFITTMFTFTCVVVVVVVVAACPQYFTRLLHLSRLLIWKHDSPSHSKIRKWTVMKTSETLAVINKRKPNNLSLRCTAHNSCSSIVMLVSCIIKACPNE